MTEKTDAKLRATVLAEMFLGLGAEATEERLGYYLRLLGDLPPTLLRQACDQAVMTRDEGWPPSPGAILRQASRIRSDRRRIERELAATERFERERERVLAERAGAGS